jgi:hypothetical protein
MICDKAPNQLIGGRSSSWKFINSRAARGALGLALLFTMPIHAQTPRVDVGAGANPDSSRDMSGRSARTQAENKSAAQQGAPGTLKDAIELCDRLAGVERDICLQRARENSERPGQPSIGATPGNTDTVTIGNSAGENSGSGTSNARDR